MTPLGATSAATMVGLLSNLGERVMIDFGIAGLLDRIERDFGRRAAKALTAIIGLTIVSACASVIAPLVYSAWSFAVQATDEYGWASKLLRGVSVFTQLAALVALGAIVANMIDQKRGVKLIKDDVNEAKEITREARALLDDIRKRDEAGDPAGQPKA